MTIIAAFLAGTLFSGSAVLAASYVKAELRQGTITVAGKRISNAPALLYAGKVYLQASGVDAALHMANVPFTQSGANLALKVPKHSNTQPTNNTSNVDQYGLSYGNLAISSGGGVTQVDGQITNHSKQSYSGVMITVSFFNKNGKLLGTADGAVQNLPAGQTQTFEAAAFSAFPSATKAACQTSSAF